MSRLRYDTPPAWQDAVLADLVSFLQDHCHNERKAAVAAMTLAHQHFYLELARHYAGRDVADARLDELLDAEAEIVRALPIRSALH
ncbi:MAG: hypothetical protein GY898_17520 [Proteobacteria bacterium]|nr:hypothetical protein [Pseudomonadota bacterium]